VVTFSLTTTVASIAVVCAWLWCWASGRTKPLGFRRKVVDNGVFSGLVALGALTNSIEPWTWSSYLTWAAIVFPTAVITALVVLSVTAHIVGRILRVIISTGLGVLAGVPLVVVGVQIVRLAWPSLPRDPILGVVVIGSLVGALTAATLLVDRRPVASAI